MALGSSIHKVTVDLSDIDNNKYIDFSLTLALHPSETEERMMIRLLAFMFAHDENLEFSDGLNNPDLPDIWQKNLMGDVEHWIDVGQPDEKRMRKASGRSEQVSVFTFNSYKSEFWLEKISPKIKKNKKISIYTLQVFGDLKLESLVKRTMKFNCLIEDKTIFISDQEHRIEIKVVPFELK